MTLREALLQMPDDAVIHYFPPDMRIIPFDNLSKSECRSKCKKFLNREVDIMVEGNVYYVDGDVE